MERSSPTKKKERKKNNRIGASQISIATTSSVQSAFAMCGRSNSRLVKATGIAWSIDSSQTSVQAI